MLRPDDFDSATPDADRLHAPTRTVVVVYAIAVALMLVLSWLWPMGFASGL